MINDLKLMMNRSSCGNTRDSVSVFDLLERQDRKNFREVSNTKGLSLESITPRFKPCSYNLRKETCLI